MCDAETEQFLDAYVPDHAAIDAAYETVEYLYRMTCVPEITINGEVPEEAVVGEAVRFPSAKAYDENDGVLPVTVTIRRGEFSAQLFGIISYTFNEEGEYTLSYSAEDSDGNVTARTFTINVVSNRIRGDLDGDGEITVSDALRALRIAAKLADETPEAIAIADSDGDGSITVVDALAILRVAAKLAESI